ncbi:nucleotide exchange factor GrpE [Candidatus Sulfidibacterium hydrothermale]|uniref:nucleotide exchange factor GrpE n=1 Tax=Candidatus Sulfidibacterium hydrothermale TaxID=2875962 RepID=UPI001F0B4D0D|nr:nucleotide exchange factor GrpE [Candidatus Sulfidibacterium hydrothermale]UBM63322.1 nucleotide exchange factor GrpE [Candidatus Sulfidibacterium hydrothermale]
MSTKKQDKNKKQEVADDVTFENQPETQKQEEKKEKESVDSTHKEKKKTKKSSTQKKLEELQEKYDDLNDKYMRLYSEFDNYRKRTAKERIELQKSASQEMILAILPVVDDLERAIQAFEEHHLSEEAKKGIELIYNKLMTILKQRGLEEIDAKGQPFDTDFHEAVTNIPAPSKELKGKNVDVIQKGYMLNGKVIRYAKVVVGQ